MRTQIALAALVAFAAAQDDAGSMEEAMAAAIEASLSELTDEQRAEFEAALAGGEAAQGDLAELGDLAEMTDMAEEVTTSADDLMWDDKDMIDGGWSPELDLFKAAME